MLLQKTSKNNLIYLAILVVTALSAYVFFVEAEKEYKSISSFEACVKAGYPVSSSYPEECTLPGKVFVNPRQKKEVVTTIQSTTSNLDYLSLGYLINGQSVSIGTGTENLVKFEIEHISSDVNADKLQDVLFVAEKKLTNKNSLYYLMLALGLHNGEKVAANGLLLGSTTPKKILQRVDGSIEVSFNCSSNASCFSVFKVEGDILRPLQNDSY